MFQKSSISGRIALVSSTIALRISHGFKRLVFNCVEGLRVNRHALRYLREVKLSCTLLGHLIESCRGALGILLRRRWLNLELSSTNLVRIRRTLIWRSILIESITHG